jgi:hypothetical protein
MFIRLGAIDFWISNALKETESIPPVLRKITHGSVGEGKTSENIGRPI